MRAPTANQRRKASVYMWQDRVRIIGATASHCAAQVRGTHAYTVTLRGGQWDCDCELRDHRPSWACNHIAAVWLWHHCRYAERECSDEQQRAEAATVRPD